MVSYLFPKKGTCHDTEANCTMFIVICTLMVMPKPNVRDTELLTHDLVIQQKYVSSNIQLKKSYLLQPANFFQKKLSNIQLVNKKLVMIQLNIWIVKHNHLHWCAAHAKQESWQTLLFKKDKISVNDWMPTYKPLPPLKTMKMLVDVNAALVSQSLYIGIQFHKIINSYVVKTCKTIKLQQITKYIFLTKD